LASVARFTIATRSNRSIARWGCCEGNAEFAGDASGGDERIGGQQIDDA